MFVSDKLVYLELQKTGCVHLNRIFRLVLDGEHVGSHNQAARSLFTEGRIFVGSVRNPWDWYVSLWGYGCDGRGGLRKRLTRTRPLRGSGWRVAYTKALNNFRLRSGNRRAWEATYRYANDTAAFREWLHMLHDQSFIPDIGEGYSNSALSQTAGLMTFRYLRLFSIRAGEDEKLEELSTQTAIKNWDAKQTFIDDFIRNESLETDVFRILENHGIALEDEKRTDILARPRSNTSSRKRDFASYYDAETIALVANRDQLIIDKFAYVAPEL